MELGAEVILLHADPDGTNINRNCGSLHPEVISEAVAAHGANAGISLDGDADRVIMADEKGQIVDGDHIMGMCALDMRAGRRLRGDLVVATVMSNCGLERALERAGIKMLRTKVGDRYVLEEMLKRNASLGGEQSGHIIFRDFTTTGDGMITALQVLRLMRATGKKLSRLRGCVEKYPQVLVNVEVREKRDFKRMPRTARLIARAEEELGRDGRVLVRYSGTENIARVMIEGKDRRAIAAMARRIAAAIRREIG